MQENSNLNSFAAISKCFKDFKVILVIWNYVYTGTSWQLHLDNE